jgi:hypothetical protein
MSDTTLDTTRVTAEADPALRRMLAAVRLMQAAAPGPRRQYLRLRKAIRAAAAAQREAA